MPFDQTRPPRPRIAVIGGGISGLSAAWELSGTADVTLFEAERRLGGHARTVFAGRNGDQPVDTGFIVFNYANYPHLARLFADLDVPVKPSDMSFGVTVDGGRLEYALRSARALFAQRRNAADPRFWGMLRDIAHFNARAEAAALSDDMTIAELADELRLGAWFRRYYLLPICGAIWSTPGDEVGAFPARTLVRFFRNHALMSARGQHRWWTVDGGSVEYVERLSRALAARGVRLRPGTPVATVRRRAGQVHVKAQGAAEAVFDQVILASHPDQALRMIQDASGEERRALSAIRYQDNHAVLHADARQMPRRRACWSSWVHQAETGAAGRGAGVTYWMNRLQGIDEADPLFVTLNPARPVAEELIYDQTVFSHPVFDRAALAAQVQVAELQGRRNTWFAGAWLRHGFHEDGIASAMRVTRALARRVAPGTRAAA